MAFKYEYYNSCAKLKCKGQIEERFDLSGDSKNTAEFFKNGETYQSPVLAWISEGFFCNLCGTSYSFEKSPNQLFEDIHGKFWHLHPKPEVDAIVALKDAFSEPSVKDLKTYGAQVSKREQRRVDEINESIAKGLKESEEGKLIDRGSFAKYAEDEPEEKEENNGNV